MLFSRGRIIQYLTSQPDPAPGTSQVFERQPGLPAWATAHLRMCQRTDLIIMGARDRLCHGNEASSPSSAEGSICDAVGRTQGDDAVQRTPASMACPQAAQSMDNAAAASGMDEEAQMPCSPKPTTRRGRRVALERKVTFPPLDMHMHAT